MRYLQAVSITFLCLLALVKLGIFKGDTEREAEIRNTNRAVLLEDLEVLKADWGILAPKWFVREYFPVPFSGSSDWKGYLVNALTIQTFVLFLTISLLVPFALPILKNQTLKLEEWWESFFWTHLLAVFAWIGLWLAFNASFRFTSGSYVPFYFVGFVVFVAGSALKSFAYLASCLSHENAALVLAEGDLIMVEEVSETDGEPSVVDAPLSLEHISPDVPSYDGVSGEVQI